MTQDRKPRIALSPLAYRALKMWAALEDKDPGDLAGRIILTQMPSKLKDLLPSEGIATKRAIARQPTEDTSGAPTDSGQEHGRLKDDPAAIQKIKDLWKSGQHNQAEIARVIGYPRATTADNVRRMRKAGELEG
jgi:hypothetical protein